MSNTHMPIDLLFRGPLATEIAPMRTTSSTGNMITATCFLRQHSTPGAMLDHTISAHHAIFHGSTVIANPAV